MRQFHDQKVVEVGCSATGFRKSKQDLATKGWLILHVSMLWIRESLPETKMDVFMNGYHVNERLGQELYIHIF